MNAGWSAWRRYFENNQKALPKVREALDPEDPRLRRALARSLAIFQLGEAGEGRIAHQVEKFAPATIDDDWRASIRHWVREEGRHGRVLGDAARALGGKSLSSNWTNELLIVGRRLLGLRLKLLVILCAEVIGITFYGAIASKLRGDLARALAFIAEEETFHLAFHAHFFHLETRSFLRRFLFRSTWWTVGSAAGLVVLLDHQRTLRLLGLSLFRVAAAFLRGLRDAERAVLMQPRWALVTP